MAKETVLEPKKYGRFQWFFFVVFIPLIFAVSLSTGVLYFAGVDVGKEVRNIASHVPFVNTWLGLDPNLTPEQQLKLANERLEKDLQSQQTEVKKLQSALTDRERELQLLNAELEKMKQDERNSKVNDVEKNKKYKQLAKVYDQMTPKQAAEVFSKLNANEAVEIMKRLNEETLKNILENVTTEQAAIYTNMLLR